MSHRILILSREPPNLLPLQASSLAELDRSRRLKWDYAADIASGRDPATPVAGLGGSGDLSGSGELRMRMSMSQASFVSSPDPEDSALEAAIKGRDLAVLKVRAAAPCRVGC